MPRLLPKLAATLALLLCPSLAQTQEAAASPATQKLIPGVPPCATKDQFNGMDHLEGKIDIHGCYQVSTIGFGSLEKWKRFKPYSINQHSLVTLYLTLPIHEAEIVIQELPYPNKVERLGLGHTGSDIQYLPKGLSRFSSVWVVGLSGWSGRQFPNFWKAGLKPKNILVHSNTGVNIPQYVLNDKNLVGIIFETTYESIVADKLLGMKHGKSLVLKWVGLPADICSYNVPGVSKELYTIKRSGMPDLDISSPFIARYCFPPP